MADKREWPCSCPRAASSACCSRSGLLHTPHLLLAASLPAPWHLSVPLVVPALTEGKGVPQPLGTPLSLAAGSYHKGEALCLCNLFVFLLCLHKHNSGNTGDGKKEAQTGWKVVRNASVMDSSRRTWRRFN